MTMTPPTRIPTQRSTPVSTSSNVPAATICAPTYPPSKTRSTTEETPFTAPVSSPRRVSKNVGSVTERTISVYFRRRFAMAAHENRSAGIIPTALYSPKMPTPKTSAGTASVSQPLISEARSEKPVTTGPISRPPMT